MTVTFCTIRGRAEAIAAVENLVQRCSGFDVAFLADVSVHTELSRRSPGGDLTGTVWAQIADDHGRPDEHVTWCNHLLCDLAHLTGCAIDTVTGLLAAYGLPGSRHPRLVAMLLAAPTETESAAWITRPPDIPLLAERLAARGWWPPLLLGPEH